jgi:fumarylpyruvate hydrolase
VVPVAYGQTQELSYPAQTRNNRYEAEWIAVIGKGGSDISENDALDHVWG